MGVPIVSETNKSKELLLEIDSIVPDTKGHRLADVSLSSNDSLSQSRRRWKLIRIISKMNPNLQGKSKKLIFYQSLSALLALILTGITVYWLVSLNTASNSSFESPSSSSSSSMPIPTPTQLQSSSTPPPYLPPPASKPPSYYAPSSEPDLDYTRQDNPILRLMEAPSYYDDGVNLKIDDSTDSTEPPIYANGDTYDAPEFEDSEDSADSFRDFPPFSLFPPFPGHWFTDKLDAGGLIAPSHPLFLSSSIFPPQFEPIPEPDSIDEPAFKEITTPSSNLAKIRLSAKKLHASAVGALDEIMRKLKDNQFVDFLVNGDDNLKPELIRSEDVDMYDPYDSEETGSTVGFVDVGQLGNDDGSVDNLFNFIKKIVF